jgi:hypothetical protein
VHLPKLVQETENIFGINNAANSDIAALFWLNHHCGSALRCHNGGEYALILRAYLQNQRLE